MKYTARYLRLSLKRAAKAFPTIALLTLLLCAGVLLTGIVVARTNEKDDSRQRVKIGVVGNMNDSYLGVGLFALQNIDNSRYMIDLVPYSNVDEAKEAVKNGDAGSFILIPDGFVDSIVTGENTPLTYVMKKTSAPLGASLMGEVARSVSSLITESQTGVTAVQELSRDYDLDSDTLANDANLEYIGMVLSRDRLVSEELSDGEYTSFYGYIFCGAVSFFLMLWGITCSPLLARRDSGRDGGSALVRLMESKCGRSGSLVTSFGDYVSFFALAEAVLLILAAAGGAILTRLRLSDPAFRYLGPGDLLGLAVKLIPAVLALTALEFLLFELSSGVVGSILLQFTAAAGLGYVSGFFYPIQFFPEPMRKAAEILPSGAAFTCVRQSFSGSPASSTVLLLLVYALLFFAVSVFVRRIRMKY